MERGAKAVEESTGIKAEFKTTKTLLTATNGYNYFTVTITPFDPTINGSYAASTQAVNEMITKTFKEKIQNGIVDTASTKKTIDGLEFSDFRVTVRMGDKVLFTSSLLSRLYKGYDFGISCLYVDEKAKTLLENMLDTSRFTK